jgi:hypothetical protein
MFEHLFRAVAVCDGQKGKGFGPFDRPNIHADGRGDFMRT